jgi:hypothetical protein
MRSLPTTARRAHALLAALLISLATTLCASVAHAQQSEQMVGGPLTTKRFERLLRAYVQPTTAEATALDRLHEAYLDRFRAEIDPELAQLGQSMGGGMPTVQEFRKFMREVERLQARIADADAALLSSCAELIAEERRPGLARIRDARERQRALGGFTRMSSMMFGGGGNFVDLADLVSRDRVLTAVPADMRARFDAFLASQEARLLVQARSFDKATSKALEGLFEAMVSAQNAASQPDATDPALADGAQAAVDAAERARAAVERQMELMRTAGAEPRKVVAANFAANRSALSELSGVLPASVLDELRIEVANRAAGEMMMMTMMSARGAGAADASPAVIAARMRRDGTLDADSITKSREIVSVWRSEHATALEAAAEAVLEGGAGNDFMMRAMAMGMGDQEDGEAAQQRAKFTKATDAVDRARQKAFRALANLGFGRGLAYFAEGRHGEDAMLIAKDWKPQANPDDELQNADASAAPQGRLAAFERLAQGTPVPEAPSVPELLADLALLGAARGAEDTVESVHTAWKAREYDARIEPLRVQANELGQKLWTQQPDGSYAPNEANATSLAELRQRLRDEYLAVEDALLADLAAALGLATDGPELVSIKLGRLHALAGDDFTNSPFDGGSVARIVTPLQAVARARLEPEAARAFVDRSIDTWRKLLAELPARTRARAEARRESERIQNAMMRADGGDPALMEQSSRAWARMSQLAREDSARVRAAFAEALSGVDEATAARLRSAERALAYPTFHRPSDSASDLLARAIGAKGATDDHVARLEALKAEYDAVFESITARMIEESARVASLGDGGFQEMMRQREGIEKLRFQRDERTSKARSEARRILGDALAATVRGLVPDEDDELLAVRAQDPFTPFATADED